MHKAGKVVLITVNDTVVQLLIEGGMGEACDDVIQYACGLAHDSCITKEDDKSIEKGVIEVTITNLVEVTSTQCPTGVPVLMCDITVFAAN